MVDFPIVPPVSPLKQALREMKHSGTSGVVYHEGGEAFFLSAAAVLEGVENGVPAICQVAKKHKVFRTGQAVKSGYFALDPTHFGAYSIKPPLCACDICGDVYPSSRGGQACDSIDGGVITCD